MTDLFPRDEPLKGLIRKKANEIFAGLVLVSAKNPISLAKEEKRETCRKLSRDIEIIQGYFKIAENQEWLDERNFFVLKEEYDEIKQGITMIPDDKFEQVKKKPGIGIEEKIYTRGISERAKKILRILGEKEKAQVKDFQEVFPGLTKRTLRRDFVQLLKKGLIERQGEGKYTVYRLKI